MSIEANFDWIADESGFSCGVLCYERIANEVKYLERLLWLDCNTKILFCQIIFSEITDGYKGMDICKGITYVGTYNETYILIQNVYMLGYFYWGSHALTYFSPLWHITAKFEINAIDLLIIIKT